MRRTTAAAAIGLSLAAAVTLGACANPFDRIVDDIVGDRIENFIEDQVGDDVDISIPGGSGASLPSGWPDEVPTPDGEILFSLGTGGTYSATILVADQGVVDRLFAELDRAGYTLTSEADLGGLATRVYENELYTVTAGVLSNEESGDISLQYSISEK